MKKLSLLLLASTLFFTTQCTPAVDKEIETLDEELMTGHDEVMPKSMKLGSLKDDVLVKAAEGDSTSKSEAAKIANNLQAAEDDMYKWMDDYSAAMNDEPDKTKKVEMYRTLKVEVDRISTNTDNAMQAASDFIANKE
jgi:hypothetical protein